MIISLAFNKFKSLLNKFFFKKNNFFVGFTLIEVLVSTSIIALLAGIAVTSYASANKKARDNKRKSDLEQTRAALEIYRADDDSSLYPYGENITGVLATLSVGEYLKKLPEDPKPSNYYYYNSTAGIDYNLCTALEQEDQVQAIGCDYCGPTIVCNYGLNSP